VHSPTPLPSPFTVFASALFFYATAYSIAHCEDLDDPVLGVLTPGASLSPLGHLLAGIAMAVSGVAMFRWGYLLLPEDPERT